VIAKKHVFYDESSNEDQLVELYAMMNDGTEYETKFFDFM